MFEEFESREIDTGEARIFVRRAGNGPGLETHLIWRDLAPSPARHFTVVCADLRGSALELPLTWGHDAGCLLRVLRGFSKTVGSSRQSRRSGFKPIR
ncbi:alpha/beta fold hydrolase [Mesorhizobium sp. ORM8.1]